MRREISAWKSGEREGGACSRGTVETRVTRWWERETEVRVGESGGGGLGELKREWEVLVRGVRRRLFWWRIGVARAMV